MQKTTRPPAQPSKPDRLSPRDRILQTAAELFYRHGIHSVGIDRIIEESGVAKMTFYRHFPSKACLIAEYLAQQEQNWQCLVAQFTGDPAKPPVAKLLAIFDALELAIRNPGFCGCPFIKALAEFGPERNEPEVRAQIARHFTEMERVVTPLLRQARPTDAKKLLQPLMSLITGTIVVAQATGHTDVASRNKAVARSLLAPTQKNVQ
jgi:AcrR family transcriptional regulator